MLGVSGQVAACWYQTAMYWGEKGGGDVEEKRRAMDGFGKARDAYGSCPGLEPEMVRVVLDSLDSWAYFERGGEVEWLKGLRGLFSATGRERAETALGEDGVKRWAARIKGLEGEVVEAARKVCLERVKAGRGGLEGEERRGATSAAKSVVSNIIYACSRRSVQEDSCCGRGGKCLKCTRIRRSPPK